MAEQPGTELGRPPVEVKPSPETPVARDVAPELPLADVLAGASRREVRVLDHGFLALLDVMPRLVPTAPGAAPTADGAVVQAARVSYGQGTKKLSEDRGLIRYLLRHRHSTPFEMVEFKFHVAMPIFVARQWIRHRTASVPSTRSRYSVVPDRFYIPTPENIRKQSRSNRQGGSDRFSESDAGDTGTVREYLAFLRDVEALYPRYAGLLDKGVSRELARIGLPVNVYTEWYWKCDLHNVLRFLSLRMDDHAQEEIRAYARAMHDLIAPIVPLTIEAWRDYEFEGLRLSRPEIEAIRSLASGGAGELPGDNQRERDEWAAKRGRLGLTPGGSSENR